MINKKHLFAIFPYIKTTNPVYIRGILLRSNDNLEGLSPEQQVHLKTLFSMFFLRNDLHITHMIYACLELHGDQQKSQKWIDRLYEAQALINYLYSSPHPNMGNPFLYFEHASLFTFQPDNIYKGLVWPSDPNMDYGVENLANDTPEGKYIDGYSGRLNGTASFRVAEKSKIYPPVPHLSFNFSQDLLFDLARIGNERKNWAFIDLVSGYEYENQEIEQRVFRSLDWHNRSTMQDIIEDSALVHLAIAFESLLNLEQGKDITKRFKETVQTLLGFMPGLESWLEQFYNARSGLVHKGKLDTPMFTIDLKSLEGKVSKAQYRSLTTYGRLVFRLCLNAILSGTMIAERGGLSPALFITNEERLQKICRHLGEAKDSPVKLLQSISNDVCELQTYHWESEKLVESKTLINAGKLALETYLETKPNLPEEADILIKTILEKLKQKKLSEDEKLESFNELGTVLSQVQDQEAIPGSQSFNVEEPQGVVILLLNYITSPDFSLRKWYNQKPRRNNSVSEASETPEGSNMEFNK